MTRLPSTVSLRGTAEIPVADPINGLGTLSVPLVFDAGAMSTLAE